MTADPISSRYPDLPRSFDAKARRLIFAMTDVGFTGRVTSKGHWLAKAPDGETFTVAPKSSAPNRGAQNAEAQFKRWLRNHAPAEVMEIVAAIEQTDEGIERDILVGSAAIKHAKHIADNVPNAVVAREPWLARRNAKQGGGVRYESEAVIQRTWRFGEVDFECALEGCDYDSANPRSVATHYGKAHTASGETGPALVGPLHIDPEYTEPASTRDYRPTERLVQAFMDFVADAERRNLEREEYVVELLTFIHERPDIEHTERPLVPLTDKGIIDRIRLLVGAPDPDQTATIEVLRSELEAAEGMTIEMRRQRDEANAHLVKVQRDLDSIRDMMKEVGR